MVPWAEGAEFCRHLAARAVPAKHLIYAAPRHNDFVAGWPLAAPGHVPGSGAGLPPFAADAVAIVTGRAAAVRFPPPPPLPHAPPGGARSRL
jgi:hypothetical protein